MIQALLAPVLTTLASSGLTLLAEVIKVKGKQVVEDKLGMKIPDEVEQLTPEIIYGLKIAEMEHEEALQELLLKEYELDIALESTSSVAVTERWKYDMTSDSWLSKNVRPFVLLALLSFLFIFAILSAFGVAPDPIYVELLKVWGGLALSAYFICRTHEKVKKTKGENNETK
jgi:hypothetical protein